MHSNRKRFSFGASAALASFVVFMCFYGVAFAEIGSFTSDQGVSRPTLVALKAIAPKTLPVKQKSVSAVGGGVKTPAPSAAYIVSVKSVKRQQAGVAFREKLRSDGYNAYISSAIVKGTKWYRVRVGFFKDRSVAKQALKVIRRAYGAEAGSAWIDKGSAGMISRYWRGGFDAPTAVSSGALRPIAKIRAKTGTRVTKGSVSAIRAQTAPKRGVSKAASGGARITKNKPASLNDKITINFVDVNITTLVKFISDTTGKNFIFDERLRGKVSIVAPVPINRDEAFNLFTSLLALKGFAMVRSGEAYKIVPSSMVKTSSIDVLSAGETTSVNEGYIARVIDLKYAKSFDLLPLIKPLISPDGYISSLGQSNSVLLIDTSLNIEKIMKIVKLMDVKSDSFLPELVFLKHADVEEVIGILSEGTGSGVQRPGRGVKGASGSAGGVRYISDKRLNAIIIFGTPTEVDRSKELIAVLDVPSQGASSRINVYYLENADAVETATVLKGLLGESTSEGVTINAPQGGAGQRFGAKPNDLSGKIAITPDPATNSLIIMASPESYTALKRVIKKLDRRPKQVFVEAMIVEVSVNEAIELGHKWQTRGIFGADNVAVGSLGTVSSGDIGGIISGLAGFSIGVSGNIMNIPITAADGTVSTLTTQGYSYIFAMSEVRNVVEVLSTPHILTSDNKEAEIIVGENVPFLSQIERSSSSTNQPLIQSIERKDVGITLRIKPQVSEGGYVKLDIYQEISSVAQESLVGASDLITKKRSASTSIVVKDRQTVVIGGLISNNRDKSLDKIPILGDIPLIGWLFKSKKETYKKTNLIVYLTPTIIDDFDELDEIRKKREKLYEEDGGKLPYSDNVSSTTTEVEGEVMGDPIDTEL